MQLIKYDALHYLLLLITALDQPGSELYDIEVVTLEGNFVITRNDHYFPEYSAEVCNEF